MTKFRSRPDGSHYPIQKQKSLGSLQTKTVHLGYSPKSKNKFFTPIGRGTHIPQSKEGYKLLELDRDPEVRDVRKRFEQEWDYYKRHPEGSGEAMKFWGDKLTSLEQPKISEFNKKFQKNYQTQNEFYRAVASKEAIDDYFNSGVVRTAEMAKNNNESKGYPLCFSTDPDTAKNFGNIRMVFDANSMREQVKPVNYRNTVENTKVFSQKNRVADDDGIDFSYAYEQELRSYKPVQAKLKRIEVLDYVGFSNQGSDLYSVLKQKYPNIDITFIKTGDQKPWSPP